MGKMKFKGLFSIIVALLFLLNSVKFIFPGRVNAAVLDSLLYDQPVSKGITYTQKQLSDSSTGVKQVINIITADLNQQNVSMIFSKAKDTARKADTLSQQIQREIFKGNNVVAGVNADFFDMSDGFSTGPQIRDGAIITGHNWRSEEKIYPVFGLDKNNKAFIDNIYLDAELTSESTGNSIDIDNVNRDTYKNNLILNTAQLNEFKKIDFRDYASNGALTVIKGIKAPIILGNEYEGIVEKIGIGEKEGVIPEDGIILASNGPKFDWIKSNLKTGDKVRIKVSYSRNDIQEALGAYTYIVKDGEALSTQDMINSGASGTLVSARKSRTAIGITADNRVIAITSDGGALSAGISDGVTMAEMGQIMRNLGALQAVAMDGGGSAQMNVRLLGQKAAAVVNRPADGTERAVTNGILFTDSSSKTYTVGTINVNKNIVIYKNYSYLFSLSGTDTNYNPASIPNTLAKWTVEGDIGKVDANGLFTAGAKGESGSITAACDDASGSVWVDVVDKVDKLSMNQSSSITLKYGESKQFKISAWALGGQPVILDNRAASWSVSGKIGTVDKNGLLKITAKKGAGEVTSKIGSTTATVKINISPSIPYKDTKGPVVSDFQPSGTIYRNTASVTAAIKDDFSGINAKTLKVKLDGKNISAAFNQSTGKLTYLAKGLSDGTHVFEIDISDRAGNRISPVYRRNINVNLKPDTQKPVISSLMPAFDLTVYTPTPRISLNVKDNQSGVSAGNISIILDNKKLSAYYDEASGWAYAMPEAPLSPGTHNIVVSAVDRAGNRSEQKNESFVVEPLKQPVNPENFTVSVTSDTHATGFGDDIFNAIDKDESELVIQNGDFVDSNNSQQWAAAENQLMEVKDKQVMVSPGNHDLADGGFNTYMKTVGQPLYAYSFEYGNSLFISLNSAYSQSISATDPTQFDYLQKILSKNKKKNVFIFTHAPTRDDLGLSHEMSKPDAQRLESILGKYKSTNPSKSINVIFGHLHTSESWTLSGVTYTITGNGCLKKYTTPDNGGFLGYTKFIVKGSNVSHEFVPIVSSISIIDNSLVNGEMDLIRGTQKALNLYGDFTAQSADYIANLSKIKGLAIGWESDNPSVVSVSESGIITANMQGAANIRAVLGDKICRMRVVSGEPSGKEAAGINILPARIQINAGESINLLLQGYDLYGNSFRIDNSSIKYMAAKNIGSVYGKTFKASGNVTSQQTGQITASYMGRSAVIPAIILPFRGYAVVTAKTLNIREKSSQTSKIVGTLKSGDKIGILGEVNGWLKINYAGKTGYIMKKYTRKN